MKKPLSSILAIVLIFVFAFLAIASGSKKDEPEIPTVGIIDNPETEVTTTEAPTSPYEYLRGEYGQVIGNKYIDGKANVMFDIPYNYPEADQSVYDMLVSSSDVSGSIVTFASYNESSSRLMMVGYETSSMFYGVTAEEFINSQKEAFDAELAYTNPITYDDVDSVVIAGETYACMQGQYQSGQYYYMYARIVDGVIFNFAIVAPNEYEIADFINSIETVY